MVKSCTKCSKRSQRSEANSNNSNNSGRVLQDALASSVDREKKAIASRLRARLKQIKGNIFASPKEATETASVLSDDPIPFTQLTQRDEESDDSIPFARTDSISNSNLFLRHLQEQQRERERKKTAAAASTNSVTITTPTKQQPIPTAADASVSSVPDAVPIPVAITTGKRGNRGKKRRRPPDFIPYHQLQKAPAEIIKLQTMVQKLIRTRHRIEDQLADGTLTTEEETTRKFRRIQVRADIMCELRNLKTYLDHMFPE